MKKGIENSVLDTCEDPRNDFYAYATGGWRKANPIPAEFSQYGRFTILAEKAREDVKRIVEDSSKMPEAEIPGSVAQKISDLYSMGLDIERRDREGAAPLDPVLKRIQSYSRENLAETIAWLSAGMDSTFFGFGVGADPGDSAMNILHLSEAPLGLGDRDYYLEKSERNDTVLEAYRNYIITILSLAGYPHSEASRAAETVIRVETDFARHKLTREQRRNPENTYHIYSIDKLENDFPAFPWKRIFKLAGVPEVAKLNVISPGFMEFINGYFLTLSDEEVKDLMSFGAVSSSAGLLGEAFYDAEFELYGRVLAGSEEKKPLWKRAMAIPNSMFGEEVGQLYVQRHFPEQNKKCMADLVANLKKALAKHISSLPWMSEETKRRALEKLSGLKCKIGYPDKWKNHDEITIDPAKSYMENVLLASEWFSRDNYSKAGTPVDHSEWFMTPQTVNAYYSPLNNEICFPAAILQPPFFDINAHAALNYGAIGAVIGHEMTHGFDDSGRKYDKDGNLNNWWSDEDSESFDKLAQRLVKQFDEVVVAPGVHANGTYTLGENIADQGGLRIAMTAFLDSTDKPGTEERCGGFTPLQMFYLSYAGIWASNIRPEEILERTQSDPHSLAVNRVNVTLRNIDEFMKAFNIEKGDKMWREPAERVVIW